MAAVQQTVAEGWALDPLEPAGAVELYRRIEAARPERVPRSGLAGHVGLTERELYELGCTLAPPGVLGASGMVAWRVVVVLGAVITALGLAFAAAGAVVPLLGGLGDPDPIDVPRGLGLAVVTLAAAAGGGWLMRRAVAALRRLAARRRRAGVRAASPSRDRHARATVAVVREPGCVHVRLLWVRGAAGKPADVEVRVLAERLIDEDDGGRAEDAIAELSEVALRADAAHRLHMTHGLAALGLRRRMRKAPPMVRRDRFARGPATAVDESWAPEPLTDDGATEVARRVALAKPERWSAGSLAPFVVERPGPDLPTPRLWPDDRARDRARRSTLRRRLRPLRWLVWIGCTTFVFAMFSGGDERAPTGAAVLIGCAGLALAALAWWGRRALIAGDEAERLWRAARAAAPAGTFAVARSTDGTTLLNIRAAPNDGGPGDLEVRTIAGRDATDLETVRQLWTVADDARMRAEGVTETTHRLRSLLARLGRVTATTAEGSLAREPLVWIASLVVPLLLAASIKHFLAGTWSEDGVGNRVLSYAWPLFVSLLLVRSARRIRDPYVQH
jgi:hypothetical protein